MSAVELLKQVKSLPAQEREKFLWTVLTLDKETSPRAKGRSRRVKWPDVEARARRIFGERVLPNLVVLERVVGEEVGELAGGSAHCSAPK